MSPPVRRRSSGRAPLVNSAPPHYDEHTKARSNRLEAFQRHDRQDERYRELLSQRDSYRSRYTRSLITLFVVFLLLVVSVSSNNKPNKWPLKSNGASYPGCVRPKHDHKRFVHDLLIPPKHPLYEQMRPPFQNLTLAQLGWLFADPWDILNFNFEYYTRVLEKTEPEPQPREDLDRYVHDFLLPPWASQGPLCSAHDDKRTLFDGTLCAMARERFEWARGVVKDSGRIREFIDARELESGGSLVEGIPWA